MHKLFLILTYTLLFSCTKASEAPNKKMAAKEAPPAPDTRHSEIHKIKKNSTTYEELRSHDISPQLIFELVALSKPIHPLNRMQANTQYTMTWDTPEKGALSEIVFKLGETSLLRFQHNDGQWAADRIELEVKRVKRTFTGYVVSSLWESAVESGMEPELIVGLTEIFAWQIDFSREVRKGDKWRLVVEEKFVEDKPIGWGSILAAQYSNSGETYTGVRYPPKDPLASYYQEDGSNLRRMFLKAPIKFGRVSSRFNRKRFHPILKRSKPHLGVDYAAPDRHPHSLGWRWYCCLRRP